MTSPNQEDRPRCIEPTNTGHENRDMHTPSLSRKRPSTSRSPSQSHREFQIVTPSQKLGRHRQYPFPPLTEPRPTTRCTGAENIWPPPCSTSPFVTPGAGANIGRRRRANAISLVDSPSRRGHSQAMARIFEDAHRAVITQDYVRKSSLSYPVISRDVEPDTDNVSPRTVHDTNDPAYDALGTVRVKRPKKTQDQGASLCNVDETSDGSKGDSNSLSEQQRESVRDDTGDGMPPNEIKSWLEGIFEYEPEQTTENLPGSLSYTLEQPNSKHMHSTPSPSASSDKENRPPKEKTVNDKPEDPSPCQRASCLSTLLKSAPRRGKIQTTSSTPALPVSLPTRWRPAILPMHNRGRSSKRSDSIETGQPHAKSAVLTEHAQVVVEDDPEVSSKRGSSEDSSEEFVDARAVPFNASTAEPCRLQAIEKLRVDSNATTAVEHESPPSRSPLSSAPGLASALAIKIEKRKSSPQNSEDLRTILSDPTASAQLLEASGIQRAPSYSFPSSVTAQISGDTNTTALSASRFRVLTPEVQKFRKGKGPEKPRCPSYYDEDLEETTPRRSARLARK